MPQVTVAKMWAYLLINTQPQDPTKLRPGHNIAGYSMHTIVMAAGLMYDPGSTNSLWNTGRMPAACMTSTGLCLADTALDRCRESCCVTASRCAGHGEMLFEGTTQVACWAWEDAAQPMRKGAAPGCVACRCCSVLCPLSPYAALHCFCQDADCAAVSCCACA